MAGHLLTFELSEESDELTIYGDAAGLRLLAARVNDLALKSETRTTPGIEQLSASVWGGNELSLQPQGADTRLIYHVRIVTRPAARK